MKINDKVIYNKDKKVYTVKDIYYVGYTDKVSRMLFITLKEINGMRPVEDFIKFKDFN